MKCAALLAVVFGLMLVPAGDVVAQGARAVIRGTIQDVSGGVLPGVTVTARPFHTGTVRSTATDNGGRYEFTGLAAGDYEISAVLTGFGSYARRVTAGAGETVALDVTLAIAPLSETVTVTRAEQDRSGVPNAVSVIERDRIQQDQRLVSPAEAFSGIPGLFVENRHNFSLSGGVSFAVRAPLPRFGLRGLQIVQDGVPLTMADGTTEPTNIDLGSLGRVEVLRGPSSVLYGNSAGGVISLRTEFPASGTLVVEPTVQFGSYGYQQQQVKVQGTSGNVSYVVNASRLEVDGFREHSAANPRRANMIVRAGLSPDTEIRGVFNFYDLPFGQSPSTLTLADARDRPTSVRPQAFDQGWGESSTQGQGGVTLEHHFGGAHVFRGTGWALWRDVLNPIPFRIIDLGRNAGGFRSEYEGRSNGGPLPLRWTAGVDISRQSDDRAEFRNAGGALTDGRARLGTQLIEQLEEVTSVSPFVQASAQLALRWQLTAGVRYDRYDFSATDRFTSDGDQSGGRTLDAVSPMVGVTYMANDWLNVYGNFATANQTPTTVELSNRPTGEGGFNEELGPEKLKSVEGGLRGAFDDWRLRFELVGYRSRLDDALVQFARPDEQIFFRNAGEARRRGIEALAEWTPIPRLQTRFAYTWQNFEFERFVAPEGDFSGNKEPAAPPHQLFIGAGYDTPFGLRAHAQLRVVDSYPVNNANTVSNWAYQVVDARFGYDRRWNGVLVRPFLGINNLFDERYNSSVIANSFGNRFFEPAPGREVYVGLTIGADVF